MSYFRMKFRNIIIAVAVIFIASTETVSAGQIRFTSISSSGGAAGAVVTPVLVFAPNVTVPIGGTITLTMPAGYFLGSVTSIAAALHL